MSESAESDLEQEEAGPYFVELLYETAPDISRKRLLDVLQETCPGIAPLDRTPDSDLLAFVHTQNVVKYTDGELPAQCLVATADRPPDPTVLGEAVQQSWQFPDAAKAVAAAKVGVLVSDFMAAGLPPKDRLQLFHRVLAGVLRIAPCVAIYWHPTQQIVDPQAFLQSLQAENCHAFTTPGALNVRFFRISSYDDHPDEETEDMLMDTLGLAALGLPDVQCHFRLLDPNDVAQVLYSTAVYLFENGAVIDDGHTVAGINDDEKWSCQYEESLWTPHREVVDLNPGAPYAAGERHEEDDEYDDDDEDDEV
jgi:hypothetical protein